MSNKQRSVLLKDKVKAAFNNTKGAYFFAATALVSNSAMAFTKPASGAAGYDLYTLVIENGLQGVPGFVGGAWLIAQAGQMMKESVWKAGLQAVGGAAIIKADAVLPTLGAMITNLS